jgi:hypothetical protein
MAVYVVTGKLGGGKSLLSVKRIRDKLLDGLPVATNLDLNLEQLVSPFSKTTRVMRIPDKPTIDDLNTIGKGNLSYDEELNGLLVLDECGTWFNSRNWNDKTRKPVNDWFLHARKLGWDVILIIQDVKLLDSQAREAIAEHTVFCKRLDRLTVPFISPLAKLITGKPLTMPKLHVARVVYGISHDDFVVDRWAARGNGLYKAYDTKQAFLDEYPHGTHSLLPPYYTHGWKMAEKNWRYYMRLTRIFWKRFRSPIALGAGMLIGTSVAVAAVFAVHYDPNARPPEVDQEETVTSVPELAPDPILDQLAVDGAISGSWVTNSHIAYSLRYYGGSDAEGNPQYVYLNTRDLETKGYTISPENECSLVVERHGQSVPVYCF